MGHAIYHPASTNQEAFFQNRGRSRRPRATAGEWVRDQNLFQSWLNKEGALLGRAGLLSPSFLLASSIPGPGSPRVALRLRKWQHTLRGRNTNADNGHERAEGVGVEGCAQGRNQDGTEMCLHWPAYPGNRPSEMGRVVRKWQVTVACGQERGTEPCSESGSRDGGARPDA